MTDGALSRVGIAGSGKMGADLFLYLMDHDFSLSWLCLDETEAQKATAAFRSRLERKTAFGEIGEEARRRVEGSTVIGCKPECLAGCDLVIEAIPEDRDLKAGLFLALDAAVGKECVLTSNSSSILPSRICPPGRGERFAGLHFFYPVRLKAVVELIAPSACGAAAVGLIKDFVTRIGKIPLVLSEEGGFILNRVFLDFQAQAYRILEEGRLDIEEIDGLVRESLFPVGVFEFLDAVGIDVILNAVREYTRDDPVRRAFCRPWLRRMEGMVATGSLGMKSGKGFYLYVGKRRKGVAVHVLPPWGERISTAPGYDDECREKLTALYLNAVLGAVEKGYAPAAELDFAVRDYIGPQKGPLSLAQEMGREKLHTRLLCLLADTGEEVFRPAFIIAA